MRKNFIVFLLLWFCFLPTIVKAENLTPKVDNTLKVYDFAELLSEEEESKLHDLAFNYIEKYNMDMVFVIINENPYGVSDNYTRLYSQDFYDYNDFGIGETKDGIIFLIDMANRYPYISTTGEAILMYDDVRIDNMHNDAYSYLKSGDYYKAFETYGNSASDYASVGVPKSNKYYCIDPDGEYYKCKEEPKSVNWIVTILGSTLGSLIIVFIHLKKYKGVKLSTNANSYMKNTVTTKAIDTFLTTFTSKTRKNNDSGGSGGHLGGGSSISHGSFGRSHGGGGGHHF